MMGVKLEISSIIHTHTHTLGELSMVRHSLLFLESKTPEKMLCFVAQRLQFELRTCYVVKCPSTFDVD